MQPLAIITEIVDVEIIVFLCSLLLFFALQQARKTQQSKMRELKVKCVPRPHCQSESDAKEEHVRTSEAQSERDEMMARYAQIEKNLHLAFESEDLWQALRCWYAMKKFKICSPRYLAQIIKTMQSCNKTDEFIVTELRDYLWKHRNQRTSAIVNDFLEPLARQLDYCELVEAIMEMTAGLNINKDARTYEILLTMYVTKKDATKAQELMAEMTTYDIEFTPCALVAVMTMALQLDKLDVALKAFKKLKISWDIRSTWAVSPFALQRHKANTLIKFVELGCKKRRLTEVLEVLEDMSVPEEVMTLVSKTFASLNDVEVASMAKVLGSSNSNKFSKLGSDWTQCLEKRSKALLRSHQTKIDSDASTSEGSRSDSEDDMLSSPLQVPCRA